MDPEKKNIGNKNTGNKNPGIMNTGEKGTGKPDIGRRDAGKTGVGRNAGKTERPEYSFRYSSPLGPILLYSDGEALTGLYFDHEAEKAGIGQSFTGKEKLLTIEEKSRAAEEKLFTGEEKLLTAEKPLTAEEKPLTAEEEPLGEKEKQLPIFEETIRWLDLYFAGHDPAFTPKLKMNTTPFRKLVWEIMLTIPYGKTMSYGEIARKIEEIRGIPKMSAQAVGQAVGSNAISLIIPCHRVIGTDGSLTGYGGGLDKKVWLLKLEKQQ